MHGTQDQPPGTLLGMARLMKRARAWMIAGDAC
jgi:hypothetical protein